MTRAIGLFALSMLLIGLSGCSYSVLSTSGRLCDASERRERG